MSKPDHASLGTARNFSDMCLKPRFFSAENAERMRRGLELFFMLPWFYGTAACKRFLLEYDIRDVGYAVNDPFPNISPQEWLTSLGIDIAKGKAGIFDAEGVEQYEQKQLRRYKWRCEHLKMLGYQCADPQADIAEWGKLLDQWEKEFKEKYGRSSR